MDLATETPVSIDQPGAQLTGRLFLPLADAPRKAVQISAATGVPAGYYAGFARWLAGQGHAVLIYDYSHTQAPRRARVSMADWGVRDVTAARNWLAARFEGLPLVAIGHSLGGLCLPFQGGLAKLEHAICVAAGPVHLSDHPWRDWPGIASTWHGHGPVLTAALGYLPGRRLGLGADIPAPVFWQWRRWCARKGSCRADPQMPPWRGDELTSPVTLIAFADDGMVPPEAVWRLQDWMPEAQVTRQLVSPAEHGLANIGHIAAFAPRNAVLWPVLVRSFTQAETGR